MLLDAVMPDLDGLAVAGEIKHDPALAGATVMMLTSADRPGELARCRELGIAAYLPAQADDDRAVAVAQPAQLVAAGGQGGEARGGAGAAEGAGAALVFAQVDGENEARGGGGGRSRPGKLLGG